MKAICCGSFDPITKGHEDLILRAARLFDEVAVVVAKNPEKRYFFSAEERAAFCRKVFAGRKNVTVIEYDGVVVDLARQIGAGALVKGFRNGTDAEYELRLAEINRRLAPEIETVLLPARPEYAAVSSTCVREFLQYHKALDGLVPEAIRDELKMISERV